MKFEEAHEGLRLDLGTGKGLTKPPGFVGVDKKKLKGVDKVVDLTKRWPWKDGQAEEINAHYLLNYLKYSDRIHVMNEAHRVLKVGGKMTVVVPHWCASKAYGDDVQWPPVSESWFTLLRKEVRDNVNWEIEGYKCDFDFTLGYGLHPSIMPRAQDYQQHAMQFFKEAAQDIVVTLIKR